MDTVVRRRELAEFLKTRRARLTPADVGIIGGLRRRTPGLRREEVAELAGMGLAWYTWLEQARDIHVSNDVFNAIARALRLSSDERAHLFALAHGTGPAAPMQASVGTVRVTDAEQLVLDALDPNPAHIRDDRWDLLAWNSSFAEATRFDQVPIADRNLLWLMFTHPVTVELTADWEAEARFAVAQFRFECARRLDDPGVLGLVARLSDMSSEFRKWWSNHDVTCGVGSTTEWRRPPTGDPVRFQRTVFPVESAVDPALHGACRRLSVLVPIATVDTSPGAAALAGAA
jgi:hypothetical protein